MTAPGVLSEEPTAFQSTSLVRKNLKHLTIGGAALGNGHATATSQRSGYSDTNPFSNAQMQQPSASVKIQGVPPSHIQARPQNSATPDEIYRRRGIKKKLTLNPNSHLRGGSNAGSIDSRGSASVPKVVIQQNSIDAGSAAFVSDGNSAAATANAMIDDPAETEPDVIRHATLTVPTTGNNQSSLLSHILSRSQASRATNKSPPYSPQDTTANNTTTTSDNSPPAQPSDDSSPLNTMSSMPSLVRTPVEKHKKASLFQLQDLVQLGKIGSGNSGTVLKVLHVPSSTILSKKVIPIEKNNDVINKQLLSELQIMKNIKPHPNIITFYGAYLKQSLNYDIIILMEYMDCGSLDKILHVFKSFVKRDRAANPNFNPRTTWFNIPVVVSKISHAVLAGLNYLYENYKIIHRDIKPSNVLVNGKGSIKICDFGVSKKLINSVAETFVGTSTYMSPERIQGNGYSVKGDVWSLGLMVIELVTGEFPLGGHNDTPRGILDLLQRIVNEPAPTLPTTDTFPDDMRNFVERCCVKDARDRGSISELLGHSFIARFNANEDPEVNEKYDAEFKHWCRKIKYKLKQDKQIKREKVERAKLEKMARERREA